ncbi:MAG TPA: protein kinase [Deltaproteobacteria bacterium]|nr:protein kinase [Deltaproteobacteria bacterium]HQB38278.1 protein kinase [Deltaproteobacteria bacterium]
MEDRIIFKYQIRHVISQTESVELLVAEHLQLGKRFFIKSLAPLNDSDGQFRDRFYDEARLLARLNHPNILQATDFFQLDGRYYLAMEYFDGPTLEKMLNHNKQFPEQHALHYFKQLLRGLSFAHEQGVVHRNMRPAMILMNRQGQLKISDFGVAMILGNGQREELGQAFGDAGFMSPEQIINPRNIDQRSDIYSAGVILFQMLTGALPFAAESSLSKLMLHLDQLAPDVRSINPDISERLALIVAKALEKSPDDRYQSCREFLNDIEAYQKSLLPETFPQPPLPAPPRRLDRRTLLGVAASVLVVILLGSGLYSYMTREEYVTALRLHGSNTIGSKLAPALAEAYLRKLGASRVIREQGQNSEEMLVKGLTGRHRGLAVEIRSHGSSTAFQGLAGDGCDIGMSSRRIKDGELKKLSTLGDLTSLASEHILGLDGVAVIVNENNPVSTLAIRDLGSIFSGGKQKWPDFGGGSAAINVYSRDDKSGTFDTFSHLVLGKKKLLAEARRFEDSAELSAQVTADRQAIGFIGLPYIKSAKALAIKSGASMPVYPTPFTVATEDYPLARRLYLYTAQQPKNPRINEFIEFALSREGQEIVERTGFVSLTVKAGSFPAPEDAPQDYRRLTASADRLSLNFKYRSGSLEMDNKGKRDIGRLIAALGSREFQGRTVMLFGFSDSSQGEQENDKLSRARAQAIADELRQRGVVASVVDGFGSRMPVADNRSDEGRARNNRVEVWLERR